MVLSKSGGRQTSPGPSWAVLAEPTPTSSPSPSMRSDVEMGDDEQEEESQLVDTPISTPGVKRKAIESPPIRGRAKVPKLHAPSITDHISLSSSSDREPGPSRTQASKLPNTTSRAPFMSQPARPSLPVSPRPRLNKGKEKVVESSRSSSDSLEGGATLTQRIVKIVEKEKPRWARKSVAGSSGRKVSNQSLLQRAQMTSGLGEGTPSAAQTRIRKARRKLASQRLPRPRALNRVVELTDSDQGPRVIAPRPSLRATIASSDDPIVITSGSEKGATASRRQPLTQGVRVPNSSQMARAPRPSGPPPANAEVIVISDSDSDTVPAPPVNNNDHNGNDNLPLPPSPAAFATFEPLPPSSPPVAEDNGNNSNLEGLMRSSSPVEPPAPIDDDIDHGAWASVPLLPQAPSIATQKLVNTECRQAIPDEHNAITDWRGAYSPEPQGVFASGEGRSTVEDELAMEAEEERLAFSLYINDLPEDDQEQEVVQKDTNAKDTQVGESEKANAGWRAFGASPTPAVGMSQREEDRTMENVQLEEQPRECITDPDARLQDAETSQHTSLKLPPRVGSPPRISLPRPQAVPLGVIGQSVLPKATSAPILGASVTPTVTSPAFPPALSRSSTIPDISKLRVNTVKVVGESLYSNQFFARPLQAGSTLWRTATISDSQVVTGLGGASASQAKVSATSSSGTRSVPELAQPPGNFPPLEPCRPLSITAEPITKPTVTPASDSPLVDLDDDVMDTGDDRDPPADAVHFDVPGVLVEEVAPAVPNVTMSGQSEADGPTTGAGVTPAEVIATPATHGATSQPGTGSSSARTGDPSSTPSVPPPLRFPRFPASHSLRVSLTEELNRVSAVRGAAIGAQSPVHKPPSTKPAGPPISIDLTLDDDSDGPPAKVMPTSAPNMTNGGRVEDRLGLGSMHVPVPSEPSHLLLDAARKNIDKPPSLDAIRAFRGKKKLLPTAPQGDKAPEVAGPPPSITANTNSSQVPRTQTSPLAGRSKAASQDIFATQSPQQRRVLSDRAAFLACITPSQSPSQPPGSRATSSSVRSTSGSATKGSMQGSPQGRLRPRPTNFEASITPMKHNPRYSDTQAKYAEPQKMTDDTALASSSSSGPMEVVSAEVDSCEPKSPISGDDQQMLDLEHPVIARSLPDQSTTQAVDVNAPSFSSSLPIVQTVSKDAQGLLDPAMAKTLPNPSTIQPLNIDVDPPNPTTPAPHSSHDYRTHEREGDMSTEQPPHVGVRPVKNDVRAIEPVASPPAISRPPEGTIFNIPELSGELEPISARGGGHVQPKDDVPGDDTNMEPMPSEGVDSLELQELSTELGDMDLEYVDLTSPSNTASTSPTPANIVVVEPPMAVDVAARGVLPGMDDIVMDDAVLANGQQSLLPGDATEEYEDEESRARVRLLKGKGREVTSEAQSSTDSEERECVAALIENDGSSSEVSGASEGDHSNYMLTRSRASSRSSATRPTRLRRQVPRRGRSSTSPVEATGGSSSNPDPQTAVAERGPTAIEYIGGYPVLTWESQVRAWREAEPTYLLAKDLPHSLQDHVNNMPLDFRQSDQARILFEALIDDASDNEPHAPKIEVWDNDIGLETTPPWEFVYTNEMWYSENVPPPDLKNLQSCGCIGRCDPKSKTCSCVNKQYSFLKPFAKEGLIPRTWDGSGFLYNRSGKLQLHGYPIFECNQFCGCDEDCPNRVVQNGRQCVISINNTKEKGWGVFAGPKKIPKGTYIGIYAGELLTEKEGDDRGVYYNKFGRTYLFYIDYFYLENEPAHFVVDAYHAGNFTRFLNHSCDPNCALEACYINEGNIRKPLLAIFTVCDVEPYEELCFSYFGEVGEDDEENGSTTKVPQKDAVYAECRCGSKNCRGRMF